MRLVLQLHLKIRHDSELAHHTLNCLIQLSSLNGSVMTKKETRLEYLSNYLRSFLGLLDQLRMGGCVIQPIEALGFSNIVRKLILFFPPSLMVCIESKLLEKYLHQVTHLTCHFMKAASHKTTVSAQREGMHLRQGNEHMNFVPLFLSQMDEDSTLYEEAFEHMLEVWVSVLHEAQSFPGDFCRAAAVTVFDTYLQCHLSPPDGVRGVPAGEAGENGGAADDEEEEIGETEEPDRIRWDKHVATGDES